MGINWSAVASVGGSLLSAYLSNDTAKDSTAAVTGASDRAARLNYQTSLNQLSVIQDQFVYQQEVIRPLLQGQYNAQSAYHKMLGIGGDLSPSAVSANTRKSAAVGSNYNQPLPDGYAYRNAAIRPSGNTYDQNGNYIPDPIYYSDGTAVAAARGGGDGPGGPGSGNGGGGVGADGGNGGGGGGGNGPSGQGSNGGYGGPGNSGVGAAGSLGGPSGNPGGAPAGGGGITDSQGNAVTDSQGNVLGAGGVHGNSPNAGAYVPGTITGFNVNTAINNAATFGGFGIPGIVGGFLSGIEGTPSSGSPGGGDGGGGSGSVNAGVQVDPPQNAVTDPYSLTDPRFQLNTPTPPGGANNNDFNTNIGPNGYVNHALSPVRFGSDNATNTELYRHVDSTRLADPRGYEYDERFKHAANTAIVADNFETSPGYGFAKEEMQRELDRKNSAGGNYGGRAVMEAQRRANGLANQEYYNWAALRSADLGREDRALDIYTDNQRGDNTRLDNAVISNRDLRRYDTTRQDQSYYNYISHLAAAAGFGNPSTQAVGTSQNFATNTSNVYGSNAAANSANYQNLGVNLANIRQQQGANTNAAIQGGLNNYLTYQGTRQ